MRKITRKFRKNQEKLEKNSKIRKNQKQIGNNSKNLFFVPFSSDMVSN